jgi:hypothetical protein
MLLKEGEPPGNVQAYVAICPSASVPLPKKETAPPGLMVIFDAGLSIDAVGA